ncbi:MAG TPA: hypothetical protein VKN14_07150 [Flavobacteriaceae bacterium]|nr:hypothetical protein [Flavobacteriaceae bacterium]
METEGVTFNTDPEKEKKKAITEVLASAFGYGILVGFLFCVSIFGLSQQLFSNYQALFYSDNIYSIIRHVWVNMDWKIWMGMVVFSYIYGRYSFYKIKKRMFK